MTGNTDDTADGTAMDDERRLSRRAVLGTIGAGALAGTAATIPGAAQSGTGTTNVTATATPTGSPPPAPTGMSADRPTMEADLKVTWGEPVDPCATDLDHYEVLVDGAVEVTVPVGVSFTWLYEDGGVTVGVRSVDADGRRSTALTRRVSPSNLVADPSATVSPDAPDQAVATGSTLSVPIVSNPILGRATSALGETYELTISTPCVARIRSASAAASATVSDDGTTATLDPGGTPDNDGQIEHEPLTIGCVEIETLAPGHTGLLLGSDASFVYSSTLSVADDGAVPAETNGLSSSCSDSLARTVTLDNGTTVGDVDGDGEFMDITNNGEVDNQDVVAYFQFMEEPLLTDYPQYFDYTDNGEIDYQDLIALWNAIPA